GPGDDGEARRRPALERGAHDTERPGIVGNARVVAERTAAHVDDDLRGVGDIDLRRRYQHVVGRADGREVDVVGQAVVPQVVQKARVLVELADRGSVRRREGDAALGGVDQRVADRAAPPIGGGGGERGALVW